MQLRLERYQNNVDLWTSGGPPPKWFRVSENHTGTEWIEVLKEQFFIDDQAIQQLGHLANSCQDFGISEVNRIIGRLLKERGDGSDPRNPSGHLNTMVREAMGALRSKDEWDPRAMRQRGLEYLESPSNRGHYEWTESTVSRRPECASGVRGSWPPVMPTSCPGASSWQEPPAWALELEAQRRSQTDRGSSMAPLRHRGHHFDRPHSGHREP